MDAEQIVIFLVIGGVAGWLAGLLLKGRAFGLVGNVVIGVVGAFLGSWLFEKLDIHIGGAAWVSLLITSLIGSTILLFAVSLIPRKK